MRSAPSPPRWRLARSGYTPGHLPVLDADEAAQWAVDGRLIDVRTAERFRGDMEPIDPVSGHIPGSVNLPMALLQHSDGTFRSAAQIRAELAAIGVDPSAALGTSCGSGVTATQMTLALHQANIESVPYIGSWSEWITDPSRPVATGD